MSIYRAAKRLSKEDENMSQTKKKRLDEKYGDFSSDGENYAIESVHSDSVKDEAITIAEPVTNITAKSDKNSDLANKKSKMQNKNANQNCHIKESDINESGFDILNTSQNKENCRGSNQNDNTDSEIRLSFDCTYFRSDNLSQLYKLSQNKNIEFIPDSSDNNLMPMPMNGVTILKTQENDLDLLSKEFQCTWNNDKLNINYDEMNDSYFRDVDCMSENCRDDLSQFYDSSQFLKQIENVISTCDDSLNDSNITKNSIPQEKHDNNLQFSTYKKKHSSIEVPNHNLETSSNKKTSDKIGSNSHNFEEKIERSNSSPQTSSSSKKVSSYLSSKKTEDPPSCSSKKTEDPSSCSSKKTEDPPSCYSSSKLTNAPTSNNNFENSRDFGAKKSTTSNFEPESLYIKIARDKADTILENLTKPIEVFNSSPQPGPSNIIKTNRTTNLQSKSPIFSSYASTKCKKSNENSENLSSESLTSAKQSEKKVKSTKASTNNQNSNLENENMTFKSPNTPKQSEKKVTSPKPSTSNQTSNLENETTFKSPTKINKSLGIRNKSSKHSTSNQNFNLRNENTTFKSPKPSTSYQNSNLQNENTFKSSTTIKPSEVKNSNLQSENMVFKTPKPSTSYQNSNPQNENMKFKSPATRKPSEVRNSNLQNENTVFKSPKPSTSYQNSNLQNENMTFKSPATRKSSEVKNSNLQNENTVFINPKPSTSNQNSNLQNENTFKSPTTRKPSDMKNVISKIRENEETWDDSLSIGLSQLFKSTQYKRKVESVFNNLERSISHISEGQDINLERDITINQSKNITVGENTINNIDWANDSIANLSLGISAMIQKAVLNNGQNNHSVINNDQDQIIDRENEVGLIELGPFYGLPIKVQELVNQYKGIDKLYDWQDECLNLEVIKKRKNLVYALPTSGGKTLVSEILIMREILCRQKNVLFVLPFVSIVQEKVWALSPFALGLDFLVDEYAAGKGSYPPRKRRHKHTVYVCTTEKALGLINSLIETDRIKEIGLVVVDELHLLGESGRGSTLEILLTKLMYAKENIQIIGMSATIGNLPEVCEFLKAEVYTKEFRPVELKEYVKCENEIAEVNRQAKNIEDSLVPVRSSDFGYSEAISKIDPDRLGALVMEVVPSGSCLVFCASKKNCENVALLLCRVMLKNILKHKRAEKEALINFLRAENTLCPILRRTLPFGVAYHHSGLTSDERRIIEDGFRSGTLSVICCTSTLAAGVNLPAKRVILRSPYIARDFISLSRYKQMVGRAGRAGFGEIGESILVCDKKDLKKVAELLCSPMDQVLSRMCDNDSQGIRNLVLSCIALGIANTRRTLRQVTSCTLMAVQRERLQKNIKKITDEAITHLFKLGALQLASDKTNSPDKNISILLQSTLVSTPQKSEENSSGKRQIIIGNDSRLVISKLGKAAIKGGLSFDTAHILYEDLVQAQASLVLLSCLHLLYLVTPYDLANQMRPSLPTYYSIYVQLGLKELQTARVLGLNEACEAGMITGRRIKSVNERVLNRFYLTLIIHDLWNGKPVFEVAERYQVSRGIVQQLTVSAATFASNVVRFCEELNEFWAFADLLRGMSQRLQHCSSKELLPLMDLPSVKQNRARQLYKAGYKTLQSIAKANPTDLMESIDHICRRVANQLIASAKLLLLEKVENLREEAEDVLEGISQTI